MMAYKNSDGGAILLIYQTSVVVMRINPIVYAKKYDADNLGVFCGLMRIPITSSKINDKMIIKVWVMTSLQK